MNELMIHGGWTDEQVGGFFRVLILLGISLFSPSIKHVHYIPCILSHQSSCLLAWKIVPSELPPLTRVLRIEV